MIARTSRNTGVTLGPFSLLVLLLGGLVWLVAAAVVMLVTLLAGAAMYAPGEIRRHRAVPGRS
jgi:uncharacterized membrane protein